MPTQTAAWHPFDPAQYRFRGNVSPNAQVQIATSYEPIQTHSHYMDCNGHKQGIYFLTTITIRCPTVNDPLAHTRLYKWDTRESTITPWRTNAVEKDPFELEPHSVTTGLGCCQLEVTTTRPSEVPTTLSAVTRANLITLGTWLPQFTGGTMMETGALYGYFDYSNGRLYDQSSVAIPTRACAAFSIGCDRFLRINGRGKYGMVAGRDIQTQKGYTGPAVTAWAQRELAMLATVDLAVPLDWYL